MLLKVPQQKVVRSGGYMELASYHHWPVVLPQRIRLYTYEQIPQFLKENPFITDGYRAHLPSKLCLKSIFMLSNETVNIWTHLLGFLLFFTLGVNDLTYVLPSADASHEDYLIYAVGLFCFQVCMLCSVGYHLFSCHRNERTCRRWLALDYAGISVGILGCYVPGIYYAFFCNTAGVSNVLPATRSRGFWYIHCCCLFIESVLLLWSEFWRQLYLMMILSLILAVFCAQVHPRYLSNDWRRLRTAIFCAVAGGSIVPAFHWVWLNGGLRTAAVELFLPRIMVMYLIAGAAFLFYVTKVPERYFPGQMNYVGASHQLWHVLVVLMFYWWHQTAVYIMRFRHSQPCPGRGHSTH